MALFMHQKDLEENERLVECKKNLHYNLDEIVDGILNALETNFLWVKLYYPKFIEFQKFVTMK
jgi:hypothetical protein